MIILSIETSCDETALSLIEATGGLESPSFRILGNALYSQISTHAEFGGVMPSLAKREHAKNIVPLFKRVFNDALNTEIQLGKNPEVYTPALNEVQKELIKKVLVREDNLASDFLEVFDTLSYIPFDCIAVTEGPGLEPALWVGISFAKAVSIAFNKPLVPVNHMEGHIVSVLLSKDTEEDIKPVIQNKVNFPALALLISGGHTELVEATDWHTYKILGQTRDDAIGEAFDKVARLLDLKYPGGPKISLLAAESREKGLVNSLTQTEGARPWTLPRPMIKSPDYHFSFSGIKTAVLYAVKLKKENRELTDDEKKTLAEEFENAVTEVLISKTKKALIDTGAKTLIIGGGVVANTYIRSNFETMINKDFKDSVTLKVPSFDMSTDNSVMIGIAGYLRFIQGEKSEFPYVPFNEELPPIQARGNLSL
jgi:N6-L-threonylcarbamoyladenine synthase